MPSKQLVLVPYDPEWPSAAELVAWKPMAYSVAKGPFIRGVLDTLGA